MCSNINGRSKIEEKAELGYAGVLDQLKGIVISPDDFDGASILLSDLPVVIIQSTEDVFVDPKNALLFRGDRLPPERVVVTDVADCLDSNAVYVAWLKVLLFEYYHLILLFVYILQSGHEVSQEKNQFVLGLLSHMLQICGARPVESLNEFNEKANKIKEAMMRFQKAEEETLDVLELAARRKKQLQDEREAALAAAAAAAAVSAQAEAEEARIREEAEEEKRKQLEAQRIIEEREEAALRSAQELARRQAEKTQIEIDAANAAEESEKAIAVQRELMLQKRNEEKKRKILMLAERKRREEKISREIAMAALYEREQRIMDERREILEIRKMEKEDTRSRFAASYFIECQIAEISAELAKQRAEEIAKYRR